LPTCFKYFNFFCGVAKTQLFLCFTSGALVLGEMRAVQIIESSLVLLVRFCLEVDGQVVQFSSFFMFLSRNFRNSLRLPLFK
jgi:hypothetical protein